MSTIYKLQDFTSLLGKSIFVDTNVLIYLFWPTGQHEYEKKYAKVCRNMLKQNYSLYVDFLVISEFINRVLRIEHKKLDPTLSFKVFRNSKKGKEVIKDVYQIIQEKILCRFKIIGKVFHKEDIESLLSIDYLDFVDKAIVSICSENKFVLLTNDTDFKSSGLDILTGNPHIHN